MATASISDLKANLSRYLREVRRGGEVRVLDRGTPVARLVPPAGTDGDDLRDPLVRKGVVRPGSGDCAAILTKPAVATSTSVLEALREDRNDRL